MTGPMPPSFGAYYEMQQRLQRLALLAERRKQEILSAEGKEPADWRKTMRISQR